jgi:hypothetical protein
VYAFDPWTLLKAVWYSPRVALTSAASHATDATSWQACSCLALPIDDARTPDGAVCYFLRVGLAWNILSGVERRSRTEWTTPYALGRRPHRSDRVSHQLVSSSDAFSVALAATDFRSRTDPRPT